MDGLLELRPPGEAGRRGIRARFPPERPSGQARSHPLVRAFKGHEGPILDLTAGLGADAYRLVDAGHRVRACERDPAVFALLATGWEEARRSGRVSESLAARLEFVHAEAADWLDATFTGELGIAVYLDPMYPPPRRASALPRRELQVLRRLLGEQGDVGALFSKARARAARVVVKRPHHAPPLAADASFCIESKLVRFDVYLDPRLRPAEAK
jgi:16S rRNA (guanine1516-N2)-methyltransferase